MPRPSRSTRFLSEVAALLTAGEVLLACGSNSEDERAGGGNAGADGTGAIAGAGSGGSPQATHATGGTAPSAGVAGPTGGTVAGTSPLHADGATAAGGASAGGAPVQEMDGSSQTGGTTAWSTGGWQPGVSEPGAASGGLSSAAGGGRGSVGGAGDSAGGASGTGGRALGAGGRALGAGGQALATGGANLGGGFAAPGGGSMPALGGRAGAAGSDRDVAGGSGGDGGASAGSSGASGDVGGGNDAGAAGSTLPADRDDCPDGIQQEITVAADGSGDYRTVGAAISALPNGSTTPTRINIKAGSYKEKLSISGRSHLCLVGAGAESTILTFDDNNASAGGTSASASTTITADDFSASHLTFANSRPLGSEQAVALLCDGDRQQFFDCRFTSYQDTLYTKNGSQYFRDCYVEGNVDYIFGGATAVLENCEVRNISSGSAVAAPNTVSSIAFGLVFLGGRLTATSNISAGSVALARPWGADGMAAYIGVELGSHISAAGWTDMSGNSPLNARFWEYESSGPGANPSARVRPQLADAEAATYTLENIFPGWRPTFSR